MAKFDGKELFDTIRAIKGAALKQSEVDAINRVLAGGKGFPAPGTVGVRVSPHEPAWVSVLRRMIGLREIPGPQHNAKILGFWRRIGVTWFTDDETAWCGATIGYALAEAGITNLPKPGVIGRALAWADWGQPVSPQVGAIGVKKRQGGGHVFLIVGETADRRFYKALGGNQANSINISDIRKADVIAHRWPAGVTPLNIPLPIMAPGTISSEA